MKRLERLKSRVEKTSKPAVSERRNESLEERDPLGKKILMPLVVAEMWVKSLPELESQ